MSVADSHTYLDSLLAGQPRLPASPLARLNQLRAHAVDRVGALTVPNTHDEEWRFTDLSPLTRIRFHPPQSVTAVSAEQIDSYTLPEAAARLVFVDGKYAPQWSFNNAGIAVENLAAALPQQGSDVERHLGRHAKFDDNVFSALNTAFLHDGALIMVPRNVSAAPVHLLFIASQGGAATYPRCLVLADANSTATIVEDYVALTDEAYFTNAVAEIVLSDNARVDHVRVQRESMQAFHVASCAVELAHASRYRTVSVAFGARLSRCDLGVVQAAEGCECVIDGLALVGGEQVADTHSCMDHAHAHGLSRQLHKCIVDGAAHAVFNGKILVRTGAQLTDSSQSSRNLLLSSRARMDTKPQLEIFADDVKCAHGATVGQLDADEVFYLKSRGLSDTAARNLLTYAFGAEIIERIPLATLRQRLEQTVLARTAHSS